MNSFTEEWDIFLVSEEQVCGKRSSRWEVFVIDLTLFTARKEGKPIQKIFRFDTDAAILVCLPRL
ncbi:hypothetical protein RB2654_10843 [Rhodobacterales bacterium HTCC2654]|uniref:Uncharacterized protein n=1 Tax=Maritimibacter alkaliphilus HTCC2654 TaxID=314271 RepID=A3VF74_9RHOB|nr:hypothetical protein RB2654_10843 [Rhodobacterales bacterium HTCC2654] [Maritimibacter alkaliphilus HTCC2654]